MNNSYKNMPDKFELEDIRFSKLLLNTVRVVSHYILYLYCA